MTQKVEQLIKAADELLLTMNQRSLDAVKEDVHELLIKSADICMVEKMYERAAPLYIKAATYAPFDHVAANDLIFAADCYNAVGNIDEQINCYVKAISFKQYLHYYKKLAILYEKNHDSKSALETYQYLANFYRGDGELEPVQFKTQERVGYHAVVMGEYKLAAKNYEEVGMFYLRRKLFKLEAKNMFWCVVVCLLADADENVNNRVENAENACSKFAKVDTNFLGSGDFTFLKNLIKAIKTFKSSDINQFTKVIADYDQISSLDDWKVKLLLRIKANLRFSR